MSSKTSTCSTRRAVCCRKGRAPRPSSRVNRRAALVGGLGKQDGCNGYDHDLAVERQGPHACIIGVARNTLFVARVISTGDLPKPRNPGPASSVGVYRRAISPQFVLGYRSRTNDAHVAHQDVKQLWQFIEARLAQDGTDSRHARIVA